MTGGRPKLDALAREIEGRGGEEYMFGLIEDGLSPKQIMEDHFQMSRAMFYRWIDLDKQRREGLLADARRRGAEAEEEKGLEILETLASKDEFSSQEVTLAAQRANWRKWRAGVMDRDRYGEKNGPNVQINVGSLHLDALRSLGNMSHAAVAPVVEAQLLPAGQQEEGDED